MAMLLGDVGGTNARLAIGRNGTIDQDTVTRFRGDDFASFDNVVRQYLQEQGKPHIASLCIAVAGPVSGGRAELTNRDWTFSEEALARLTGADQVRLINDLTALGYATPTLRGEGLDLLREVPPERDRNGQALVAGLGTGFNVCAVRTTPNGVITAMEAEAGHTQLPTNIYLRLVEIVGQKAAAGFDSLEETFSGRGLSRLHAARTGTAPGRAEYVAEAVARGDVDAIETYGIYAELVGAMCRELTLLYMPLEGLYLAGSVGRSIANRMDRFMPAYLAEEFMRHIPENTPIYLIRDDMAALQGCLAALSQAD